MFFTGPEIASALAELGVPHVIWIPDSALGPWESTLEGTPAFRLVRICREGEAWPLAAGLYLGGASPVVIMQVTGLFESGDALRNALFDLRLPLFGIIGARNWLARDADDSARRFTLPVIRAWGIPHVLIAAEADKPKLAEHYRRCRRSAQPGLALIGEGGP